MKSSRKQDETTQSKRFHDDRDTVKPNVRNLKEISDL